MKLSYKEVADLVVTMLEGGVGYWSEMSYEHLPRPKENYEAPAYSDPKFWEDGGSIRLSATEGDETGIINLHTITEALTTGPVHPRHKKNIEDGNYDAEDADVVAQVAALGEVIFS